jgi:gamma-glutamyltranspeptidase/glutathione hydrolase
MARDVAAHGGFWRKEDLLNYRAQPGVVVRSVYRGYQVVSAGGRAWGNTLSEMLNILSHFKLSQGEPTADEIELLARVIAQALADRPQELGTLKPKPDGYPLRLLSSPAFAAERAELIRQRLRSGSSNAPPGPPEGGTTNTDTTHLSVMDAAGNAVSLTTSIGPSFGARVATPELGFLYAHSYRMRSAPQPRERDLTEMTPTIVFKDGQPLLAVGAAGSERIPSAILQIISNALDRRWTLERAMLAPRIFCVEQKLRLHPGFASAAIEALRDRGFEIEIVPPDAARHQGLAHAVQYDPLTKTYSGAADPGDSGSAAAPAARGTRQ